MSSGSIQTASLGQRVGRYFSLIKFSHTVFALPFAMVGLSLGISAKFNAEPGWDWKGDFWRIFLPVLLCMVFARSAAMAFNRFLDRRFDAANPRTAQREIPAGVISPRNALFFTIACSLLFGLSAWFINPLCFYLSPVALFTILFYSYTKRFTALCHLVLGAGLALAPIGAYLAVTAAFGLLPLLFSFTVLSWTGGFDIIYALQDADFDRSQRLHSIPAALGIRGALLVSTLLHVCTGGLVIAAGLYGHFHPFYWLGAAVFISLLAYQHLIVKPSDLSRVNMAFANTNGLASILFGTGTIVSVLLQYS